MSLSEAALQASQPAFRRNRLDRGPSATLHEQVAERIAALITEHRLQPGDQLPKTNELAEMFSVSRTVVREALSALAGRGLVEVKHGKGVFVAEPAGTSILDPAVLHLAAATETRNILEARMVIEVAAAGLAATRATTADLDALQTALDRLMIAAPGSEDAIAADAEFHQAVARASRNPIFETVIVALTDPARHAAHVLSTRPGESRRSAASHTQILMAIRERNPLAAKRAMHEHLAMVERSLEWSEIMRRMRNARPPLPSGI